MLTQRREPSDNKLQPGSRLGKYELLKRLAAGGMAEIYLARLAGIEGFQKLVVLKRILPRLADSSEFVTMFLDEARLSATLEHPNIAQVHDIGHDDDGNYYFTMEFVHGEDLRNIRKQCASLKRPLPLEHALGIVIGAAAGLHAAHDQVGFDGRPLGIVHRDVSPSNILVSFDGCIKLIDFGVARAHVRRAQTRVGTIKGKAAYLSPEQCRGQPVDRRSDVFALGTLLYLLTTGRRPFDAPSELLLLEQIANARFTRPSETCGGRYPARLEAIVMKALSIDPERRYPTAQALQADVEGFARQHALPVSAIELGRLMRDLFSEKLTLWRLISRDLGTAAPRTALAPVPAREPLPDLSEETELITRGGASPAPVILPWNVNGGPDLVGDDGDSPVSVPPDLTTPVTRVVVPWRGLAPWRLIAMFAAVIAACFVIGALVARTLIP